jgi:hypothetical protein
LENITIRAGEQRYLERAAILAEQYAQSATAEATEKGYALAWTDFTAWCEPLGLGPLPAEPSTVAAYLASLADAGLKASTIRHRKAAIAYIHRWSGFEPPTSTDAVEKTSPASIVVLGPRPIRHPQRRPTSSSA